MGKLISLVIVLSCAVWALHWLSYRFLKRRITARRRWDLNVCCGTVDGGGVNADIRRHADLPNFVGLRSIYRLPFGHRQFGTALCSHTVEHVEDPAKFDRELRRVAEEVVYVIPPLWDLAAALNVLEHRWLFLSFRKVHRELPRYVRLPFSRRVQARLGQRITA